MKKGNAVIEKWARYDIFSFILLKCKIMQWMLGSLKYYVYTCIIMFYFYNLFPINKIFVFNTHPNISSNKLINGRKLTDLWCVLYVFLFYFNHRCSSEVLWIYIYISMKQPLMIDRDTGFFEMCPKFFVLKMKFKSTNTCNLCSYECPIYKQFLTSCWSYEVSD